jgi:hypothetical protein
MAFHDTAWLNSQPDGLVYAGKVLYTYKGKMPDNTVITNIRDDTIAIADSALSHWSLTNITIPSSVAYIGRDAFRECFDLASIIIPPSVTSIGDGAFYSCDNLTVTISRKTTIGKDAFPDGVRVIYSD